MTKEQYRRANKFAYIIMMIILAYMVLSMAGAMVMGDVNVRVIAQLVFSIIGAVAVNFGFFAKREEKLGSILIVLGPSLVYFIMMCVNNTQTTFMYAFPIMIVSMVYLNVRMMVCGYALMLLGTGINIVRLMSAGIMSLDFAFVEVMITILAVAASLLAAIILFRFNKENIAVIEAKAKDQELKAQNMTVAADNLMKHFDDAERFVSRVNDCIRSNNFSMENIAQSTESTAEAVQKQAEMCGEIGSSTEVAEAEIENMLNAAGKTLDTVNEGVELIQGLEKQSEIVREASNTTVKSTNELTAKIEEVEGIVGAILSISAQTNLLALNASIEAARAGDAGKGFAVVADEIRQLSEQTKDSVNKITEIINALNEYAKEANHSVEDTISSIEMQNEMIENSRKKFTVISSEVGMLSQIIEKTDSIMKGIFENTNVISENIGQLSATSEEVAASSTEGLTTSGRAVSEMEEFNRVLDSLYTIAKDLKAYAVVD